MQRPTPLPGRPGAGGGGIQRPIPQPGRPGAGGGGIQRPSPRPERPGAGGGAVQRPFPNNPNRPGGGNVRPLPGNVNDFLGIHRPGGRPPMTRPIDRPLVGGNVNIHNRPINIGNQVNNVINNRPTWNNINNITYNNIHNHWHNTVIRPNNNLYGWADRHPGRYARWSYWGDGVRGCWGHYGMHSNWFNNDWWWRHHHPLCGWHYGNRFPYYPWNYWWSKPAWTTVYNWFPWSTTAPAFQQPIYYDYGQGGNVVIQDNSVYIGGEQISSTTEFAQTAAELATVPPPANRQEAEQADWLPLGTFAVSTDEKDTEPARIVQLAVNKEGIVSGTLFNRKTDKSQTIQGKVDRQTQRVAMRFGESDEIVAETGLYNLSQDQAPVMVHFADKKVEYYLLVRLTNEEADAANTAPPAVPAGN